MRKQINKLGGMMAILFATMLLGALSTQAMDCHKTGHMAMSATSDAQNSGHAGTTRVQNPDLADGSTHEEHKATMDQPSYQPDAAEATQPHHFQTGHGTIIEAWTERPSRQHLCRSGRGICCFDCPEQAALAVMPTRPRDVFTTAITWPEPIRKAASLRLFTLSDDTQVFTGAWPPLLLHLVSWRSILLEGSARLRI